MPKEATADQKVARDEAKKFAKKFGNEKGFKYFSDGLSEEEAKDAYIDETAKDVGDKDQRITELETKVAELEAIIVEKDAKIAELEAKLNTDTASSEETPVSAEEFKKLQAENLKSKQAAGHAGGEKDPLSGGGPAERQKKEFSPLPPGLRAYASKAAKVVQK